MDVVIRSYPDVSYYIGREGKRWIYGTLFVYSHQVVFVEKAKDSSDAQNVTILLEDVVKINKATSTFIFGAIVVTTDSGQTSWFSSFTDRESVFKVLNHFHKSSLLFRLRGSQSSTSQSGVSQRTVMGTKLLHIATESMSTLAGAAVMLNEQGEKVDNSSMIMFDIHSDLDVADRITTGLEKWLGHWSLPKEYKIVKPVIIKDNDIPLIYDFELLFTKMEMGKSCQQQEGVLQLSKSGLTVLDLKQKILYQFDWSNVSKIRVISPWEMITIRYQIGKPDICFSFVSSLLVDVLHKVHCFAKNKLEYETPNLLPHNDAFTGTKLSPVDKVLNQGIRKHTVAPDEDRDLTFSSNSTSNSNQKEVQSQIHKTKEIVSDAEVQELSSTLRNLKSMMLAVGEETDIQNEKLDNVTESVNKANIKITNMNKRINNLM